LSDSGQSQIVRVFICSLTPKKNSAWNELVYM